MATDDGIILACFDASVENEMFKNLLRVVLLVGGGGFVLMLVLIWGLSFWIIRPTAEAFVKQKRFISEAGHEIKTPLTVILSSIELLEKSNDEVEKQKLHDIIKEQSSKMSAMTEELLNLSRLEESKAPLKSEFDLSNVVLTESLAFESLAFENDKALVCDAEANIVYNGDELSCRKAVGILCDNAVKHSDKGSRIEVQLRRQNSSKAKGKRITCASRHVCSKQKIPASRY